MGAFTWAKKQKLAAQLVADDELSDEEIAIKVGIPRSTLSNWKLHPAFVAHVGGIVSAYAQDLYQTGIANKDWRLRKLQQDFTATEVIVRGRRRDAEDNSGREVWGHDASPGAESGMMLKRVTKSRAGVTEEWVPDTPLIAERRALLKQAAQEAGQWTEKSETKHDASVSFLDALRHLGAGLNEKGGEGG